MSKRLIIGLALVMLFAGGALMSAKADQGGSDVICQGASASGPSTPDVMAAPSAY